MIPAASVPHDDISCDAAITGDALPVLSRLHVTGRDRAKFLHNFCTSDIKAMQPGTAVEAFFTDVKARIIAHGYLLTFDERHEVWLIGQSSEALCKHLQRYVITEDVLIVELPVQTLEATLVGSMSSSASSTGSIPDVATCPMVVTRLSAVSDTLEAVFIELLVNWRATSISLGGQSESEVAGTSVTAATLSASSFHTLRIRERFPMFGLDLSNDHLAPEAERNPQAISYRKGCYLGQEPIARLDAMGHVNRALRTVEIRGATTSVAGERLLSSDGREVGIVTSDVAAGPDIRIGLAVVRLAAASGDLHVVMPGGLQLAADVLPLPTIELSQLV